MKIVWTEGAVEDLTKIVEYIRRDSQDAATRVAKVLFDKALSLGDMPKRGHQRRSDDTWEIGIPHWPYVLIYEIGEGTVTIHGICHGSQERTR